MKLLMPTLDDRGLKGTPSDHFGSAPYFTVVDTDDNTVEIARNGSGHHVHGACQPLKALEAHPVDVIVCRGLGKRALSRLEADGIQVFVTLEKDVEATVTAFKDGRLRPLTSEEACQGHSHGGHGHSHSHSHGHGVGGGPGLGKGAGIGMGQGHGLGRDSGRGSF